MKIDYSNVFANQIARNEVYKYRLYLEVEVYKPFCFPCITGFYLAVILKRACIAGGYYTKVKK